MYETWLEELQHDRSSSALSNWLPAAMRYLPSGQCELLELSMGGNAVRGCSMRQLRTV